MPVDKKALGEVTNQWLQKYQSLRPSQREPQQTYLWWVVMAGRGYGKDLSLDTLIPTPNGFVQLRNINVGDTVFDEQGKPCKVLATHDTNPTKTFFVKFRDGTVIHAGSEHQWVTWTHNERKSFLRQNPQQPMPKDWVNWRSENKNSSGEYNGPRIRTTQQIADTVTFGKRNDFNHCIPTCFPVEFDTQLLPLHPYVFGFWLGNGDRNGATVSMHGDDAEFIAEKHAKLGFEITNMRKEQCSNCVRFRFGKNDLVSFSGVQKHVPHEYLWGDVQQRTDLLQGLMDSDGYNGVQHVEFCSKDKHLAETVFHLAASLGQKPVLKTGVATFRVSWEPTIQVFSSPRKKSKSVYGLKQQFRHNHRMIVGLEPAPVVPMRCLTVSSPNSMYLVGESFIPTHNSYLGSLWVLGKALQYPETLWLIGAPTHDDAKSVCVEGESGLLGVLGETIDFCEYKPTARKLVLPNGSMIRWSGAEKPDRFRGPNLAGAWLDEASSMIKYKELNATLIPSIRKTPGKILITTTPKPTPPMVELITNTDEFTIVTRGSTMDNAANLDPFVLSNLIAKYEGTEMGRQELYGELILESESALWQRKHIQYVDRPESWLHGVVAVDPATTYHSKSDETGIIVACSDGKNIFVLEDMSGRWSNWFEIAARLGAQYNFPVIVETNQGGQQFVDMVAREQHGLIVNGRTARFDKQARAQEPRRLYELGKVFHCDRFTELEQQMCSWSPGDKWSPDRMDALVWAVTELQWTVETGGGVSWASPNKNRVLHKKKWGVF